MTHELDHGVATECQLLPARQPLEMLNLLPRYGITAYYFYSLYEFSPLQELRPCRRPELLSCLWPESHSETHCAEAITA
jgi:hypothetical protein